MNRALRELANRNGDTPLKPTLETVISEALKGLRYGSVEIVVHDAKVVQIERKEKFRPNEAGFRLED
jgi:hypothetical protein